MRAPNWRRTTWVLVAAALAALAADCGPEKAKGPTALPLPHVTSATIAPSTSASSIWPLAPTLAAEDATLPLLDRVKARGAAHVPPVKVAPGSGEPERSAIFLGDDAALHAIWIVTQGAPAPQAVEIPMGARVLGTVVGGTVLHVWLESLAVRDQPAGMRMVLEIETRTGEGRLGDRVASLAELEKRVTAAPLPKAPAPSTSPSATKPPKKKPKGAPDSPLEVTKAADASVEALAKKISKNGLELHRPWQGMFTEAYAKLDAKSLAASPYLADIRERVHDAAQSTWCTPDSCGSVETAREDGHGVLRSISLGSPTYPRNPIADPKPKRVASHDNALATEKALRELVAAPVKLLLGEAPLGPEGATIGVAQVDRESYPLVLVIVEPGYVGVVPLSLNEILEPASVATLARFADFDGDGRTDLALQVTGKFEGKSTQMRVALRASRSVEKTHLPDDASLLALHSGADLDAGVANAVALPTREVARADACKLVKQLTAPAGFSAVSAPKAPILSFTEPSLPGWRVLTHSSTQVGWENLLAPPKCDEMTCEEERPLCFYRDGPSTEYYWFGWNDGKLVLLGLEYYMGS